MTPSFTVGQSASFPSIVQVTDTSTNVTGTITQRRVTISNAYGEYLTGDGNVNYTAWPLADQSISLDILDEDIGANVLVQWLDVDNNVVESLTDQFPLPQFNKQFFYQLVQNQGLKPTILADTNYDSDSVNFYMNIVGGINAVELYDDIAACQNCFNRATEYRLKQSYLF